MFLGKSRMGNSELPLRRWADFGLKKGQSRTCLQISNDITGVFYAGRIKISKRID